MWLFLRNFEKSQNRATTNLLNFPESLLHFLFVKLLQKQCDLQNTQIDDNQLQHFCLIEAIVDLIPNSCMQDSIENFVL